MPYPSQISREQIISTAIEQIRTNGVHKLSLGKLAKTLGVSTPSLYRHIANKQALLRAVNLDTFQRLFVEFDSVDDQLSAIDRLIALLNAQRDFAHANPHVYQLAFTTPDNRPDEQLLVQMVLPLQAIMVDIVGETRALAALRGAMALVHGFVMLELNDQLRRGGDLSADFQHSIQAYLRGLQVTR